MDENLERKSEGEKIFPVVPTRTLQCHQKKSKPSLICTCDSPNRTCLCRRDRSAWMCPCLAWWRSRVDHGSNVLVIVDVAEALETDIDMRDVLLSRGMCMHTACSRRRAMEPVVGARCGQVLAASQWPSCPPAVRAWRITFVCRQSSTSIPLSDMQKIFHDNGHAIDRIELGEKSTNRRRKSPWSAHVQHGDEDGSTCGQDMIRHLLRTCSRWFACALVVAVVKLISGHWSRHIDLHVCSIVDVNCHVLWQ
jgi:hypothetical protein